MPQITSQRNPRKIAKIFKSQILRLIKVPGTGHRMQFSIHGSAPALSLIPQEPEDII